MLKSELLTAVFDYIQTELNTLGYFSNGKYTGTILSSKLTADKLELNVFSNLVINTHFYLSTIPFTSVARLNNAAGVTPTKFIDINNSKKLRNIADNYDNYATNKNWILKYYRELTTSNYSEVILSHDDLILAFRITLDLQNIELTSITVNYNSEADQDIYQNTIQSFETFNVTSTTSNNGSDDVSNADTVAPSVPTDLISSTVTDTTIGISWNNSTDDVGVFEYCIYRDGIYIGSTPNVSFIDDNVGHGLDEFTEYTYTITAKDTSGNESEQSVEITIRTLDVTAPTQPLSLQAGSLTLTSLTLSWLASFDQQQIHHYNIYQDGVKIAESLVDEYDVSGLQTNVDYTFKVSATDTSGNESIFSSDLGVKLVDIENPTSPENVTISNITNNSLDIFWQSSVDNSGIIATYKIYRDGAFIAELPGTVTTFHDSGLSDSTEYGYTVLAFDMMDNMSNPNIVNAKTLDTVPPRMPADLHLISIDATQIDFAWNPVIDNDGVDFYRIYRNGTVLVTLTNTSYSDVSLSEYTTYTYVITAVDLSGNESLPSLQLTATTSDITNPASALNLSANNITDISLSLQWNPSTDVNGSGIDHYNVFRDNVKIGESTTITFSDTGLSEFTSYNYKIQSVDSTGNVSSFSPELSITTLDVTPPSIVTNIVSSLITNNSVRLDWNVSTDDDNVAYYTIIRNGEIAGVSVTINFIDTGLSEFTNYNYAVIATDLSGNISPMSSPINVVTTDITPPSKPIMLQGSNITATSITLGWSQSLDNDVVSEYKVYVNGSLYASTTSANVLDSAPNTINITGLSEFTNYNLTVRALDISGNVSVLSDALIINTLDITAPTAPSTLVTVDVTFNTVSLSWTGSTDNDTIHHYNIFRDDVIIWSSIDIVNLQFTDAILIAETTYEYKVIAVDNSGNLSLASNTLSVTTPVMPLDYELPATPINITSEALWTDSVRLNWERPDFGSEITNHQIFKNGVLIDTIDDINIYYDDGVTPGSTITYNIASMDVDGNISNQSIDIIVTLPTIIATTDAVGAGKFKPTLIVQTNETITWNLGGDIVTGEKIDHNFTTSPNDIAITPNSICRKDTSHIKFASSGLTGDITKLIRGLDSVGANYDVYNNPNATMQITDLPKSAKYYRFEKTGIIGNLADLPSDYPIQNEIQYRFGNCPNVYGNLSELPEVSSLLYLYGNQNIIGDLSGLSNKLSRYYHFTNTGVSGNIVNLPNNKYYYNFSSCPNVFGTTADMPIDATYYVFSYNQNIVGNIVDLPSVNNQYYYHFSGSNITGDIADVPRGAKYCYFHDTLLTGDIGDIPTGAVQAYFYNNRGPVKMTAVGGVGHLSNVRRIYFYNNSWSQVQVDAVIDSIYQARNSYNYTSPRLDIQGNNAAPSGIFRDIGVPSTGLEKIYALINDPNNERFNKWTIVYS